jgi:hypothetical protein
MTAKTWALTKNMFKYRIDWWNKIVGHCIILTYIIKYLSNCIRWIMLFYGGARWTRDHCTRLAIVETKQRSQRSLIGWVTKNLLSRAPPCYGRHVKPLVPAEFAVVSTHYSFKKDWRKASIFKKWWKICCTDLN